MFLELLLLPDLPVDVLLVELLYFRLVVFSVDVIVLGLWCEGAFFVYFILDHLLALFIQFLSFILELLILYGIVDTSLYNLVKIFLSFEVDLGSFSLPFLFGLFSGLCSIEERRLSHFFNF